MAPSRAYIGRDALGESAIGGRWRDALGERAIGVRGGGAVRSLAGAVAMGGGEERSGEKETSGCFMREATATPRMP